MPCVSASSFSAMERRQNLSTCVSNCSVERRNGALSMRISLLLLLLPIFIFAILGNLLIVVSVACFRQLRTSTNVFIVSLATADLLLAVLVMPFSLVRSVDRWRFGELFCCAHYLLDIFLCTTSIFNLSCVALDRYLAVCDPLRYAARMSHGRVAMLMLLSWLLPLLASCLLAVADLGGQNRVLTRRGAKACSPTMSADSIWGGQIRHKVQECVLGLGYANSALNPLLYAFLNRAFRHAFATLLGCGILGQQPSSCSASPDKEP